MQCVLCIPYARAYSYLYCTVNCVINNFDIIFAYLMLGGGGGGGAPIIIVIM